MRSAERRQGVVVRDATEFGSTAVAEACGLNVLTTAESRRSHRLGSSEASPGSGTHLGIVG